MEPLALREMYESGCAPYGVFGTEGRCRESFPVKQTARREAERYLA